MSLPQLAEEVVYGGAGQLKEGLAPVPGNLLLLNAWNQGVMGFSLPWKQQPSVLDPFCQCLLVFQAGVKYVGE